MTESTGLQGKKVVIVEDDPLLYSLLAEKMTLLRTKGVEVFPTLNAEEGLQKVREVKPDLITLDLVLTGMTGFDFLESLRKEAGLEKTPVLILSNLSADADKERAKALGVVAYLVKANNSLSEISNAVEELLLGKPVSTPKDNPEMKKTSGGYMVYL